MHVCWLDRQSVSLGQVFFRPYYYYYDILLQLGMFTKTIEKGINTSREQCQLTAVYERLDPKEVS